MQFHYVAITRSGQRIKGQLEVSTAEQAVDHLKKEGLYCLELKPIKDSIWHKDVTTLISRPVKPREFTAFCRQLATLLKTGTSIAVALQLLTGQMESKPFREVLARIRQDVLSGKALSGACQRYPQYFPPLFVQMTRAGELSGRLDEVLDQLAGYYEKEYRLREKVKSALTYPVIVGLISILVVTILLIFVIPNLVNALLQAGQSIPWPTLAVLGIANILTRFWPFILGGGLLVFILGKRALQQPRWRLYTDKIKMKLPVIGTLLTKTDLARFTRTLAFLLASAVSVLEALDMVSRVVNNEVLARAISASQHGVSKGDPLSDTLEASAVFPPLVTHMVRVGEQSGQLDVMLHKLADFYEDEADHLAARLSVALEPLLIMVVAVVVGGILLAALLPMFEIYRNV